MIKVETPLVIPADLQPLPANAMLQIKGGGNGNDNSGPRGNDKRKRQTGG